MADVELLPLPPPGMLHTNEPRQWFTAAQLQAYARANVARATAPLQAENERLRAEIREAREFRDKMANAIGNDQLRRFIEKHGEPVPLTIRMQEAEARAERLRAEVAELRRLLWIAVRSQGDRVWIGRHEVEAFDQDRAQVTVELCQENDCYLIRAMNRQEDRNG